MRSNKLNKPDSGAQQLMKKLLILALGLFLTAPANAQPPVMLCQNVTTAGVTTCQPISNSNPLQITGGGGTVTWPATNDIVVSNGTNSPAGLAPVNGSCAVGAGGVWTTGSCSGTSNVNLGTSVSAASPLISGDATTGFYTAGAAKVDVTISGAKTFEWGSAGAVNTGTLLVTGIETMTVAPTVTAFSTAGVLTNNASGVIASSATLPAGQFPALTGDVTTSAGALATTVAKIQGTTVSGTTGTTNVAFSASPTFTGTVTAAAETLTGTLTTNIAAAAPVWSSSSGVIQTLPACQAVTASAGAATANWATSQCSVLTASGADVTVTLSNPVSGASYTLGLCNDTTARAWTLPGTVKQAVKPVVASTCTYTTYAYDGTNYQGPGSSETASIIRGTERSAPATTASNAFACWPDSTSHIWTCNDNGSGSVSNTVVADTGAANNYISAISAAGVITKSQPAFTNISGVATSAQGGTGVNNTATLTLGSSNMNFATLGTGIVKNTTTTGALTNAASADIIALFSTCSGTQYLGADGACHSASGSGTVTSVTFTGDGTVLSSTPSAAVTTSGTVTATLLNATAKSLLGNSSGSTGAPSYQTAPTVSGTLTAGAFNINGVNGLSYPAADSGANNSIAIGVSAMGGAPSSAAYSDTAIGYHSLGGIAGNTLTVAAINNVAVGFQALGNNTSGSQMVALGYNALVANTSGINNDAIGWDACANVTTGTWNNCMGHDAGVAIGTNGVSNVAIGEGALFGNGVASTNVNNSVAIGASALLNVQNGNNTAVGNAALQNTGNTQSNTALGIQAGQHNTTGASNLFLGSAVGSTTLLSGNNNILIGTDANTDTIAAGTSNSVIIGNGIYGKNFPNATNTTGVALVGIGSSIPRVSLDDSSNTDAIIVAIGTTGQRPATGVNGMLRYNTTNSAMEGYVNNVWGSIGGSGSAGATLFSTTNSTAVTQTSATTLIGTVTGSTTVPVNTFTTGQVLEVVAEGYYTTPATPASLTIDLKIGGSVRITTGAVVQIASVTNGTWRLRCMLTTRTAGVSGTQIANCIFEGTGSTLTPGEAPMQVSSTWTIDTTATQAIDIAATWSTATGSPTITSTNIAAWIPGAPLSTVAGTAPVAVTTSGTTATVALQNSASANVTSALGTDTAYFTASGSAATSGDIIKGDASGGITDAGKLVSNIAFINQANTWSTGAQDMSAATSFLAPTSGGYAPTANGSLGYDSTQGAWSAGGAGAVNGHFPRVLYATQGTTDTLTAATINTTETQFATTYQIPANYLIANKMLRITYMLQFTTSGSPPTSTAKIRLGSVGITGTTVYSFSSPVANPVSVTNSSFGVQFCMTGTDVAGASKNLITVPCSGFTSVGVWGGRNGTAQPVLVATNSAQNINLTLTYSANTAGNTTTLLGMIVEELN